jgi:hypothetical protein
MTCVASPSVIPAVFSFALMAPVSDSYSTNAMPLRPGTSRTSLNPSNLPNMDDNASISYSSGRFWTKRILLGGRYSSGTTAAPAGFDDLRPAPLEVLIGRALESGSTPAAAADRFSLFASSAASSAFLWSAS